jgi:hypothetical protein
MGNGNHAAAAVSATIIAVKLYPTELRLIGRAEPAQPAILPARNDRYVPLDSIRPAIFYEEADAIEPLVGSSLAAAAWEITAVVGGIA